MELETINRLFLELSNFATAKTARELKLEKIAQAGRNCTNLLCHAYHTVLTDDFAEEAHEAYQAFDALWSVRDGAWNDVVMAEEQFLMTLANRGGVAPEVAGMLLHCSRLLASLKEKAK